MEAIAHTKAEHDYYRLQFGATLYHKVTRIHEWMNESRLRIQKNYLGAKSTPNIPTYTVADKDLFCIQYCAVQTKLSHTTIQALKVSL